MSGLTNSRADKNIVRYLKISFLLPYVHPLLNHEIFRVKTYSLLPFPLLFHFYQLINTFIEVIYHINYRFSNFFYNKIVKIIHKMNKNNIFLVKKRGFL